MTYKSTLSADSKTQAQQVTVISMVEFPMDLPPPTTCLFYPYSGEIPHLAFPPRPRKC